MGRLEILLSRLDGVKAGKAGRFIARCPAHLDKSPSLAIRDLGDGRILLHCFAHCATLDVLQALGLDFADLYPERLAEHHYRPVRAFSARDALECLSAESAIVALAACDVSVGKALSDHDASRVCTAAGRIASALEMVHGR